MRLLAYLFIFFIGLLPVSASAESFKVSQKQPTVRPILVNGQTVLDTPPALTRNRAIYVPIQLVENLGATVAIDSVEHSAKVISPKRFFVFREGDKHVSWNRESLRIGRAPFWERNTLYIPTSFFVHLGARIKNSRFKPEIQFSKSLNTIKKIKVDSSTTRTRLILNLSQFPSYQIKEEDDVLKIELNGSSVQNPDDLIPRNWQDNLLKSIAIKQLSPGKLELKLVKKFTAPHKVFWLSEPHRLVIDLVKIFKEQTSSNILEGVNYLKTYQGRKFGPLRTHVISISPEASIEIIPGLAGDRRGFQRETVSQISKKYKAIAAINGTYFAGNGMPLGLLMDQGEIVSSPLYNRSVLFVSRLKKAFINATNLSAAVELPQIKRRKSFHAVNMKRYTNQLVLYTPRYGKTTRTKADSNSIEFALAYDGTVVSSYPNNAPIPDEGYVISASGKARKWLQKHMRLGMRAVIYSDIALSKLRKAFHAISGGPTLVMDGKIKITATAERFKKDITHGRAPRTAIGLTRNNGYILAVVDGRQKNSKGMTLSELARLMKELGAIQAINLDGGGSSTMVIQNKVVSQPSARIERPVSNALLIVKKRS